jgi:3-dehydroquinate synthetase
LNFGHTIGHAIETATNYKRYLHGEAVALGMCLEARLSQELKFIDNKAVARIMKLVDSFGLPSALPTDIDIDHILSSMQLDKKAVAGTLKFVLPETIGRVMLQKGIKEKIIKKVLKS